jgi:hypothetical protein
MTSEFIGEVEFVRGFGLTFSPMKMLFVEYIGLK